MPCCSCQDLRRHPNAIILWQALPQPFLKARQLLSCRVSYRCDHALQEQFFDDLETIDSECLCTLAVQTTDEFQQRPHTPLCPFPNVHHRKKRSALGSQLTQSAIHLGRILMPMKQLLLNLFQRELLARFDRSSCDLPQERLGIAIPRGSHLFCIPYRRIRRYEQANSRCSRFRLFR